MKLNEVIVIDKPDELKSLLQFCQENELKSALVTTIDKVGASKQEGIDLT